jgi:hypothetical protein
MTLRIISRASWSPRSFLLMARLCHSGVRRFANDDAA